MKTYVEFDDHDGQRVRVTASSLATRPAVRVYLKKDRSENPSAQLPPEVSECLHLTLPQAQMLRAGLDEWLADVEEF